jgi:hypothetical protein
MLGITFTVYFTRNYLEKTYRNRMKYNLFFENLGMAIFVGICVHGVMNVQPQVTSDH